MVYSFALDAGRLPPPRMVVDHLARGGAVHIKCTWSVTPSPRSHLYEMKASDRRRNTATSPLQRS